MSLNCTGGRARLSEPRRKALRRHPIIEKVRR
jgi:hypothetical protein